MTGIVALALVVIAAGIVVGAAVFRWPPAVAALRTLRRVAWGYVIAILVLTTIYLVRDGGL